MRWVRLDVNTLHLQYWFLGAGFVWALAGLLSERAPAWILWPFVLVLLVAPRLGPRLHGSGSGSLARLLLRRRRGSARPWLQDAERWRLVVATVLLCGMVLTKREGLLLAAFLVVATLLGSLPATALDLAAGRGSRVCGRRRGSGPVADLVRRARNRRGRCGRGKYPDGKHERMWPSLRLALDVLFASGYWSLIVPGCRRCLRPRCSNEGVRARGVLRGALDPRDPRRCLDHVGDSGARNHAGARREPDRSVHGRGSAARVAASPLLLAAAWSAVMRGTRPSQRDRAGRGRRCDRSRTPSRLPARNARRGLASVSERTGVRAARRLRATRASTSSMVVSRSRETAQALLEQVWASDLRAPRLELDGCGRWKVFYDSIESLEQGEASSSRCALPGSTRASRSKTEVSRVRSTMIAHAASAPACRRASAFSRSPFSTGSSWPRCSRSRSTSCSGNWPAR